MTLSDPQFRTLAARIAAVSGIHVPTEKRWLLAARVEDRVRETGERDAARYVEKVVGDDGQAELGLLVEALRVGETQFFRHASQLRAIRRVALPEIFARRERDTETVVRVWSAGCATGEEPYTLAMLLEDALKGRPGLGYEVLATDLSEPALAHARAGRYPRAAARSMPQEIATWAIVDDGPDHVRVADRFHATVRFEKRNLLDAIYPRGFDLVLCRNVLIYFGRATQRDVLRRLARSVVTGGYLALGYSERLDDADGELLPLRTEDGVLYRRADHVSRPTVPPVRSRRRRSHPPGRRRSAPPAARTSAPSDERDPAARAAAAARPAPAATELSRPHAGEEPAPTTPQLSGELHGDEGASVARRVVADVLARGHAAPALDLTSLAFADDAIGRILARAAATALSEGWVLRIAATSAGTLRFLRRHNVVPPAELVGGGEPA